MNSTVNNKAGPYRRRLLATVHIAKKDLGLDDDAYRDVLETRTGERSAAKLSDTQLADLVEHFKTQGFRPKRRTPRPAGPQLAKARALWISAYSLGITGTRAEKALAAFVKRQAGLDHPAWMRRASDGRKVIEALKDWIAREAGVNWRPYASGSGPYEKPRCRVMEAQWRLRHTLGVVGIADPGALSNWAGRFVSSPCRIDHTQLSDEDADRVIEALGRTIRKAKAENGRIKGG